MTDVQDLYVEHVNARNEAEYDGAWEPMRLVHETIRREGRNPTQPIVVRYTRHGPILTDALDDGPSEALALRWVALEPEDPTLEAFLGVLTAGNWDEFTAALSKLPCAHSELGLCRRRRQHRLHRAGRHPRPRGR